MRACAKEREEKDKTVATTKRPSTGETSNAKPNKLQIIHSQNLNASVQKANGRSALPPGPRSDAKDPHHTPRPCKAHTPPHITTCGDYPRNLRELGEGS